MTGNLPRASILVQLEELFDDDISMNQLAYAVLAMTGVSCGIGKATLHAYDELGNLHRIANCGIPEGSEEIVKALFQLEELKVQETVNVHLWCSAGIQKHALPTSLKDRLNQDKIKDILILPLKGVSGKQIGILTFFHHQNIDLSQEQLQELQVICRYLGLALQKHFFDIKCAGFHAGAIDTLTRSMEAKDNCTGEHCLGVREYADLLAMELNIAEHEKKTISRAALLHDIGKMGVPDAILLKPARLSESEWVEIRKHPLRGVEILGDCPQFKEILPIIQFHHEKYDGTGYPYGLSYQDIPLGARVVALADAFEAMTGQRPYRQSLSIDQALGELRRCSGAQFDPDLVDTFCSLMDRYRLPS